MVLIHEDIGQTSKKENFDLLAFRFERDKI